MTTDTKLLPLPDEECDVRYGYYAYSMRDYARENVAHATAAKDAEIARLTEDLEFQSALTKNLLPYQDEAVASRAEIEALKTEVAAQRTRADAMAGEAIKHEFRAERLAEALRYAVDNPDFDSERFDALARAALEQEANDGR